MKEDASPNPAIDRQAEGTFPISAEERARRKEAVHYARGSSRLEGFISPPEIEELQQRYIDGDLSGEELTKAVQIFCTQ